MKTHSEKLYPKMQSENPLESINFLEFHEITKKHKFEMRSKFPNFIYYHTNFNYYTTIVIYQIIAKLTVARRFREIHADFTKLQEMIQEVSFTYRRLDSRHTFAHKISKLNRSIEFFIKRHVVTS